MLFMRFSSLLPSPPHLCPLNRLHLTVHPHIRRIYLHTVSHSPPVTSIKVLLSLGGYSLLNDSVVTMLGIESVYEEGVDLTRMQAGTHRRVLTEAILSSSSFAQDSSEVKNPRQYGRHPGCFPGDGHLRESGHGTAALLLPHNDQNHLHQL